MKKLTSLIAILLLAIVLSNIPIVKGQEEEIEPIDIPTLYVNDTWRYYINSTTYNASSDTYIVFMGYINYTISEITTVVVNNTTQDVYKILVNSDNLVGSIGSTFFISGIINTELYVRRGDLATVKEVSNITLDLYNLSTSAYVGNASIKGETNYTIPEESYDFPIKNESWQIFAEKTKKESIIFLTVEDNKTTNETIRNNAKFEKIENTQTPAGKFSCYKINITSEDGNYTNLRWFNKTVKSDVGSYTKKIIDANTTESTTMTLISYNFPTQNFNISVNLNPETAKENKTITISGNVSLNGNFLENAIITITIPETNATWQTFTDNNGNYSKQIKVPWQKDNTPTTYDISSHGIILTIEYNGNFTYTILTLTAENKPPVINYFSPSNLNPSINENSSISFSVYAYDKDDDVLTYRWYLDNTYKSGGSSYKYSTNYKDSGNHTIKVFISDGEFTVINTWNVNVINVNLPPKILSYSPSSETIRISEGTIADFKIQAEEEDDEVLTYEWFIGGTKQEFAKNSSFSYKITKEVKTIKVIVKDENGASVYFQWNITIDKKPSAKLKTDRIEIFIGEYINFNASESKDDFGIVKYKWDFDGDGYFDEETNNSTISHKFDKIGEFLVKVVVFDENGLNDSAFVLIKVKEKEQSKWFIPSFEFLLVIIAFAIFLIRRNRR